MSHTLLVRLHGGKVSERCLDRGGLKFDPYFGCNERSSWKSWRRYLTSRVGMGGLAPAAIERNRSNSSKTSHRALRSERSHWGRALTDEFVAEMQQALERFHVELSLEFVDYKDGVRLRPPGMLFTRILTRDEARAAARVLQDMPRIFIVD